MFVSHFTVEQGKNKMQRVKTKNFKKTTKSYKKCTKTNTWYA